MSYAKTLRLTPAQWRAVARSLDEYIDERQDPRPWVPSQEKFLRSAELARKKIQTAMMRP